MRAKTGALIAVGVGIVALIRLLLGKDREDEDRPAMIIKNGSITFQHERLPDGRKIGWEEDGGGWRPDQPRGRKVKHYFAEVKNADEGCTGIEGSHLVVTYSYGLAREQFHIFEAGKKPKITPNLLEHDLRTKTLRYGKPGEGRISSIRRLQGGPECTFSTDEGEIWIRYAYDD